MGRGTPPSGTDSHPHPVPRRMAREYALLGNYDTSLVYFDGVVKQIQSYLYSLEDEREREQWLKVGRLLHARCVRSS